MNEEFLKSKLDAHDRQLEDHEREIDKIKESAYEDRLKQAETYIKLDNLVESVQRLTNTMTWMLYGVVGGLLSFFMWILQNKLF